MNVYVCINLFALLLYKNLNHKRLGIYYLLAGFLYGISGTLISVLMRIELFSAQRLETHNSLFLVQKDTFNPFIFIKPVPLSFLINLYWYSPNILSNAFFRF